MAEFKGKQSKKKVSLDTIGLEMGKKPPQAIDVERSVLGAMLVEPSKVDESMEELNSSCFYDPKNRMIFEAIAKLVLDHVPIDIVTVSERLKADGNLETVGGSVALAELSNNVGAAANVGWYIQILKQKTVQRDLISASYDILKNAYDESIQVDMLIDSAQSKIFQAVQNNVKRDVQGIGSLVEEALANLEERQNQTGIFGVPSGFRSLDNVTMGWQKSDLIILAARPSVGKTAFALNLARNAAVDFNCPVAFFSLEMSALQLTNRLLTTESSLPAEKIKGGSKLEEHEWKQLITTIEKLRKAPLYIDDTPSIPVMEFRSKVKNLVNNKQVKIIFVDYLQLMQGPPELRGFREQEVAAISRTLKATAKELNVPIIALSQLSRQSVQRTGGTGKPQLNDLRESGSIEQDADMVLFLHRPDYQGLSEDPEDKGKAFVIIAKHRNGETGELPMAFQPNAVRFVDASDGMEQFIGSNADGVIATPSAMNSGGGIASAMNSSVGFDANSGFANESSFSNDPGFGIGSQGFGGADDFGINTDF